MYRSKDNLGELVLLFYHVAPRDQIRVIRLGSKCLYILIFVQQIKHRFYHQATLEFPSTRLKKNKQKQIRAWDRQVDWLACWWFRMGL